MANAFVQKELDGDIENAENPKG